MVFNAFLLGSLDTLGSNLYVPHCISNNDILVVYEFTLGFRQLPAWKDQDSIRAERIHNRRSAFWRAKSQHKLDTLEQCTVLRFAQNSDVANLCQVATVQKRRVGRCGACSQVVLSKRLIQRCYQTNVDQLALLAPQQPIATKFRRIGYNCICGADMRA